jgi:hypothetical protein
MKARKNQLSKPTRTEGYRKSIIDLHKGCIQLRGFQGTPDLIASSKIARQFV